LLGFLYGYDGVKQAYDEYDFNDTYWIVRTRVNFDPDWDTFTVLGERGVGIIDRVVVEQMSGSIKNDTWLIPMMDDEDSQ